MKRIKYIIMILLLMTAVVGCSDKKTESVQSKTLAPTGTTSTAAPSEKATVTPTISPATDSAEASLNMFTLDITLDAKNHTLHIKQNLDYRNTAGVELKEIYFNLIPEAFKKKGGGVKMGEISVGGTKCTMEQVKQTVHKIMLPSPLAAGETVKVQMEYDVSVPGIMGRFGYQKGTYNLGNCIATPAVYEKSGWSVHPYVDVGDAFYTDIANYDVTIHAPEGYTVAATGKEEKAGTFCARKVRDFAFSASDSYETLSENYEGVAITVYYTNGVKKTAARELDVAKKSLQLFGDTYGKYPYETLSVVMNHLIAYANGMEYPTLVMVSSNESLDTLEKEGIKESDEKMQVAAVIYDTTVYHEIAHQWFYGIVGNDQVNNPWLDEGFARFSEYVYQKKYPIKVPEKDDFYRAEKNLKSEYKEVLAAEKGTNIFESADLSASLYDWEKADPYQYANIYSKAASMFYQMEQRMGEEAFKKALKEYVEKFSYGFVTPETFKKFWNEKYDFEDLFTLYFKKFK